MLPIDAFTVNIDGVIDLKELNPTLKTTLIVLGYVLIENPAGTFVVEIGISNSVSVNFSTGIL